MARGCPSALDLFSIRTMREEGYEPLSVAIFAVLNGTSEPVQPLADMNALAELFSLDKVSPLPLPSLIWPILVISMHAFCTRPTMRPLQKSFAALGIDGDEVFWQAIRGNIERLPDAKGWVGHCP